MDGDELALLEASQADHAVILHVVVTACAWSCCGRGWQRRDGYEQEYWGWADNVDGGTFMLYNPGLGAPSYVIACKTADVALVERAR